MKTYGIVGVENVTVSVPVSEKEYTDARDIAEMTNKDEGTILNGIVSARMRRRLAKQGAEETLYFPVG